MPQSYPASMRSRLDKIIKRNVTSAAAVSPASVPEPFVVSNASINAINNTAVNNR